MSKGEALPRGRRKARKRKSGIEALGDEETKKNLDGGIEKTEVDLPKEEVTLGTA